MTPDFTKAGKRLSEKSLQATEFLLEIEREQRGRDQARLAHAMIVALEDGHTIAGLATNDDPSERNFLRRVVYHYERDRMLAIKGHKGLGLELEPEGEK